MDDATFWQIIASFDWSKEGDDEAVMEPAIDTLGKMTEEGLHQFDEILAQKLHVLDTQAHAKPTGFGVEHFSVDQFLYNRCAVVINGRARYEHVLRNPGQMKIFKELWFDAVLNLTRLAAEIMGIEDYWYSTKVSYETFENEAGWHDVNFPDGLPPGHKPKHQR